MKAVQITEYKSYDEQDFTPIEIPKPECTAGMVLIKSVAASINPIDIKFMSGAIDWVKPNPFTPGYDISGVVEAVGEGVEDVKVGDAVFACNWGSNKNSHLNFHNDENESCIGGTFAEYVLLPSKKVSKKPDGISHEEAAAVSLVGLTAFQCVERLLGEYKEGAYDGKRILVLGGSGAVGYIACQVAKLGGATVYTTCSSRTKDYVESGTKADHLINYSDEKWEAVDAVKDVDAVLDTTGEEGAFSKAKTILKSDGKFATIASFDVGFDPSGHPPLSFASFVTLRNDANHQDLLADLLVAKKLNLSVEETFPFSKDGVTKAFSKQASGKSMGKNVILF